METSTRIIKQHVLNATPTINHSNKAAMTGIMKLGIHYHFTELNHHQILEVLEKARIEKGYKHYTDLSKAAGYGDKCYNQIINGARFSPESFDRFCKVLKVLNYDIESMNDEQMALYLKSKGWKLQRPVTTITYVEL